MYDNICDMFMFLLHVNFFICHALLLRTNLFLSNSLSYCYNQESTHICGCIHIQTIYIPIHMRWSQKTLRFKCFVPKSSRTTRSPPRSYLHITITKLLCEIIWLYYRPIINKIHINIQYMPVYITHGSSIYHHTSSNSVHYSRIITFLPATLINTIRKIQSQ